MTRFPDFFASFLLCKFHHMRSTILVSKMHRLQDLLASQESRDHLSNQNLIVEDNSNLSVRGRGFQKSLGLSNLSRDRLSSELNKNKSPLNSSYLDMMPPRSFIFNINRLHKIPSKGMVGYLLSVQRKYQTNREFFLAF